MESALANKTEALRGNRTGPVFLSEWREEADLKSDLFKLTWAHSLAVLPDCSPSAEKSLEVVDCVLTIFLSFHSPLPVSVQ